MRTLDAAHTLVREIDPDTALTRHALRALAVNGRIPVVMVGAKRLINIDALLDILATDPTHLSLDSTEQPLSAPILPVRRLPAR
jgi:hypothetical protein